MMRDETPGIQVVSGVLPGLGGNLFIWNRRIHACMVLVKGTFKKGYFLRDNHFWR